MQDSEMQEFKSIRLSKKIPKGKTPEKTFEIKNS